MTISDERIGDRLSDKRLRFWAGAELQTFILVHRSLDDTLVDERTKRSVDVFLGRSLELGEISTQLFAGRVIGVILILDGNRSLLETSLDVISDTQNRICPHGYSF